jgi:hypothetical protein
MFLGRSTPQWLGLITSAGSLAPVLIVQFLPGADPVIVATIIGAVGLFLGAFIAFLANTATTPVDDPQLKAGTMVRVSDASGTVIGHEPVPEPTVPLAGGAVDPIG